MEGKALMNSYLLFDLDGTLANPKEGITKCVQYALRAFGIEEPDLDRLTPFIGPPLRQSFIDFYQFSEDQAITAVEKYRERFSTTGLFENALYLGIPTMLQALQKQGKILAVASSKPTVFVRQILEHFQLAQYFQVIEGSNLDGSRVEKKEVISTVLQQLGNPPIQQVIMVGDRIYDVRGAAELGIACVGVRFGFAAPGELENSGAIYLADTVSDLQQYLLSLPC